MKELQFTIPLAPVTKKNHPRIQYTGRRCTVCGKGQYPKVVPSEQFERYQNEAGYLLRHKWLNIDYPVNVCAIYYMKTRGEVDLPNLHAALHDVMKHYGVVKDDNTKIIATTDGSRVLYDKDNPRTEVIITPIETEKEKP